MAALEAGQIIDGYRVQSVLGQGGMGTVYKAVQLSMQRDVALKVLAPELAERDPSFCKRFVEEARAAGRFNHPHIIGVHEVSQCDVDGTTIYYFVMELVEGTDCKMLLKQQGRFDRELVGKILLAIADVLIYAEQVGIVHRDIKPENIMLTRDQLVKLADLGLALQTDEADAIDQPHDSKVKHKVMGTPRYMSPEQARGKKVDGRADQYCLGTTIYHMITGEPPFDGKSSKELMRAHVLDPVPNPADIADVPRPWCELIMTMMAKRPDDRYPSAVALKTAATRVVGGQMPPRVDATEIERLRPHRRSSGSNQLIGLAIGSSLLLIIGYALHNASGPISDPQGDDDHGAAEAGQEDRSPKLARARNLIASLTEDDREAVHELQAALKNNYFSQHEAAYALLQEALDARQSRLQATTAKLRQAAEKQLRRVAANVDNNPILAWETLKAMPPEQQEAVEDAYQQLRQQISELARQSAADTRRRIDQARNHQAIDNLLGRYRNQVHADLIENDIQRHAKQRMAVLEREQQQRRKDLRQRREQEDAQTWQALEQQVRDLRGTGRFEDATVAAEQAARRLHAATQKRAATQLAERTRQLAEFETIVRAYVADEHPRVTIHLSREQDARLLQLDENRITMRLNTGNMTLDRTRAEVPWQEIATRALADHAHLAPIVPQYLWFWKQPGGHAPEAFGGEAEGPDPVQSTGTDSHDQHVGIVIDVGRLGEAAKRAFSSDDELQLHNDRLIWHSEHAVSRSKLSDDRMPTLRLDEPFTNGSRVAIDFTLHDGCLVLIGVGNGEEIIRLAFNTETTHLTGAFISKGGQAVFDGDRGTVIDDSGSLTGDHHLDIQVTEDGTVLFILDGTNWIEMLDPRKMAEGPHSLKDPTRPLQLIIQGLPKRGAPATIGIRRIAIEDLPAGASGDEDP